MDDVYCVHKQILPRDGSIASGDICKLSALEWNNYVEQIKLQGREINYQYIGLVFDWAAVNKDALKSDFYFCPTCSIRILSHIDTKTIVKRLVECESYTWLEMQYN